MSFRFKLTLMMLIPVIGMLVFSSWGVRERLALADQIQALGPVSELAVLSSNLVHELQKERGMSAGYIGARGQKFISQLPQQRALSDSRYRTLVSYLKNMEIDKFDSSLSESVNVALAHYRQLPEIRTRVTKLNISVKDEVAYYTRANALYLQVAAQVARISSDSDIARNASAYINFLQAKERAGIERAVLSNTFARDNFAEGMYKRFIELVTVQETYIRVFNSFASAEQKSFYIKTLTDDSVNEVARMRSVAFDKAVSGGFEIDPELWFTTITKKINLLKKVENYLAEDLVQHANRLGAQAKNDLTIMVFMALGILLTVVGIAWAIWRELNKQIDTVFTALIEIESQSNLSHRIGLNSRDEIGQISNLVNRMLDKFTDIVTQISSSSSQLSSSSQQLAVVNEQMKNGVQQQRGETEQVATSMTQMLASVHEVARNAAEAANYADQANDESIAGREIIANTNRSIQSLETVVGNAVEVINQLQTQSNNIGAVLNVIGEIADQTNLLALNAAIEAARAGEQGRGFAVVADEVRALAHRTQQSTQEIHSMVQGIQDGTNRAVSAMQEGMSETRRSVQYVSETGSVFESILSAVKQISDMNSQIASSVEEQILVIEEINRNTVNITQVGVETLKGAEQSVSATSELAKMAMGMSEVVGRFRMAG